jgi:hypothetical protein
LGDGVELIKEEDTWSGLTGLFKDVTDIGFGLTKPHSEKFRSLDRNEVSLAFVGDSLGHESLTTPGRAIEEHTLAWRHAELFELFGMFHGVLDEFLEVALL